MGAEHRRIPSFSDEVSPEATETGVGVATHLLECAGGRFYRLARQASDQEHHEHLVGMVSRETIVCFLEVRRGPGLEEAQEEVAEKLHVGSSPANYARR
jgi:hypothetical protein